jgi:gamma-glutamyltranspeptidase/glutathione hydrolase/leukotriene-C4 hydrolase
LDYGKSLYDAIATPRIHHQLMPNIAIVENGFDKQFRKQLIKRGHQVSIKFNNKVFYFSFLFLFFLKKKDI